MLGVAVAVAARRRTGAIEALAHELHASPSRASELLADLPDGAWTSAPQGNGDYRNGTPVPASAVGTVSIAPATAPPLSAAVAPDAAAAPGRGRPGILVALAGLSGIAVIAVVIATGSGGDGAKQAAQPAQAVAGVSATSVAPLTANGRPAGVATATPASGGSTVGVQVTGLPRGTYRAWLFTTVIGAKALGDVPAPAGSATFTVPADAFTRYTYLDVSRQASLGNAHSGISVLRVPLADLRGTSRAALLAP